MAITKVNRFHNRGRATATNFTSETLLNRSNVENVQMGVADGALGLILDMLTDISANCGAYAVREVYSNAQDAIRGMSNGRIDITLTLNSDDNSIVSRILKKDKNTFGCFTISDNGIGMSADDVRNLFLQYGGSNKRDNADSIGSKGLGSKAPLAITDNFMVVTVKDGVETTVNIHRDGDNNSADIQSCSTDKPNGTSVIVPIMSSETYMQVEQCVNLIKQNNYDTNLFVNDKPVSKIVDDNKFISKVVKINDTDAVRFVVSVDEILSAINGRWKNNLLGMCSYQATAVIGGYPYVLKSNSYSSFYRSASIDVRVFMQPGFFDFTPSRDEIMMNDASKDFVEVFQDKFDDVFEDIVKQAVNRVACDDSLSVTDKVRLISPYGIVPDGFGLADDVFDNQYKLTTMLSYDGSICDVENDEYKALISKRDASIPRYFMIEKDKRNYRAVFDNPLNHAVHDNMSGIVSRIRENIATDNGSGLDSIFYANLCPKKNVVVYAGNTDDYLNMIRTFGCVTRAVSDYVGKEWSCARYIFLLDTDTVTDDIKDIINMMGIKSNNGYFRGTQVIDYYTFDELNKIVNMHREAMKANRNTAQPKNLDVIMYDISDKDNDDTSLDWEYGHKITDINDIHDGLVVLINSPRYATHSLYSECIKNVLTLSNDTTKGYLIINAKADTVRAIMKNKNLRVLADKRTRVNQHYANDYPDYHITSYNYLTVSFDSLITTQSHSPVYQQYFNMLEKISNYTSMTGIINILNTYYTDKTNKTATDQTIHNAINEIANVSNQLHDIKYNISYNTNITVPDTEYNHILTQLIKIIATSDINTIEMNTHTTDEITNTVLTKAIIEIIETKLTNSINEYHNTHDTTN